MEIVVDCYGVAQRLAGGPEHRVRLEAGGRVADALAALAAARPGLEPLLDRCACAVGDTVVSRDRRLAAGERLALLPPVSGG